MLTEIMLCLIMSLTTIILLLWFKVSKNIDDLALNSEEKSMCPNPETISQDKFTIISFHDLITINDLVNHLKSYWNELTKGLPKNALILFFAGAHGTHYQENGVRKPSGMTRMKSEENSLQIIKCLKMKVSGSSP